MSLRQGGRFEDIKALKFVSYANVECKESAQHIEKGKVGRKKQVHRETSGITRKIGWLFLVAFTTIGGFLNFLQLGNILLKTFGKLHSLC